MVRAVDLIGATACGLAVCSVSPAAALSFRADGYAKVFNASAAAHGFATRIYVDGCTNAPDQACGLHVTQDIDGNAWAPKAGGDAREITFSFPAAVDQKTAGEITVIVFATCSPDADASEQKAAMADLTTQLQAAAGTRHDVGVKLRGVYYRFEAQTGGLKLQATDDPQLTR